jgi:hypothetical protein
MKMNLPNYLTKKFNRMVKIQFDIDFDIYYLAQ